jgi:Mn-dependent DtxR family transcriptional regulator
MNKTLIDFRREPGVTKARDIQDELDASKSVSELIEKLIKHGMLPKKEEVKNE